MKTQFTPGPWTIDEERYEQGISHFAISSRHNGEMVCSVSPTRLRREQDDANARLIAAAPELFAALQALLPTYIMAADSTAEQHAVVAQARKALAKASNPA